jgi:hypothetical protein
MYIQFLFEIPKGRYFSENLELDVRIMLYEMEYVNRIQLESVTVCGEPNTVPTSVLICWCIESDDDGDVDGVDGSV